MDPKDILRRLLSRALRNDYIEDTKNNREVRKWHAILVEVRTPDGVARRPKWVEIHDAPASHMRIAFSLRRRAAMHDVVQLEFDYEYWMVNNKHGDTLPPLDYNFNPDVEESKQPTHYPDEPDVEETENPEDEGPEDEIL